ncbi:MAG: hypothetical protein ACSLFA_12065 [Mycobacterium sp.]
MPVIGMSRSNWPPSACAQLRCFSKFHRFREVDVACGKGRLRRHGISEWQFTDVGPAMGGHFIGGIGMAMLNSLLESLSFFERAIF